MKPRMVYVSIFISLCSVLVRAQTKTVVSQEDGSSATYLLIHPMHEVEATSKHVQYTAVLDPEAHTIQSVSAVVDVTTFDSGNSNRDSHAMEVIDALSYPDVTFNSTAVIPRDTTLLVQGKLTFHGVTNNVTATAVPSWVQDKLVVHAAFPLSLTAFKVERPSLLFIPVQDTLRFTLVAVFPLK